MRVSVLLLAAIAALPLPFPAVSVERPAHMPILGRSKPIKGHHDFCRSNPAECPATPEGAAIIPADQRGLIEAAALKVNRRVVQKPDNQRRGQADVWEFPDDNVGDCEDFVLEKRRILIGLGYPRGALLITKATQPNGEGHAILTVVMSDGDRILDNLNDDFPLWQDVPYRFDKRVSSTDSSEWVDVEDADGRSFGPAKPTAVPSH